MNLSQAEGCASSTRCPKYLRDPLGQIASLSIFLLNTVSAQAVLSMMKYWQEQLACK